MVLRHALIVHPQPTYFWRSLQQAALLTPEWRTSGDAILSCPNPYRSWLALGRNIEEIRFVFLNVDRLLQSQRLGLLEKITQLQQLNYGLALFSDGSKNTPSDALAEMRYWQHATASFHLFAVLPDRCGDPKRLYRLVGATANSVYDELGFFLDIESSFLVGIAPSENFTRNQCTVEQFIGLDLSATGFDDSFVPLLRALTPFHLLESSAPLLDALKQSPEQKVRSAKQALRKLHPDKLIGRQISEAARELAEAIAKRLTTIDSPARQDHLEGTATLQTPEP